MILGKKKKKNKAFKSATNKLTWTEHCHLITGMSDNLIDSFEESSPPKPGGRLSSLRCAAPDDIAWKWSWDSDPTCEGESSDMKSRTCSTWKKQIVSWHEPQGILIKSSQSETRLVLDLKEETTLHTHKNVTIGAGYLEHAIQRE